MSKNDKPDESGRRKFFKLAAAGSLGAMIAPSPLKSVLAQVQDTEKPATNIADALKYPRKEG
jgi:DNA-binding TFAR19-related protein (PDSD5 family)